MSQARWQCLNSICGRRTTAPVGLPLVDVHAKMALTELPGQGDGSDREHGHLWPGTISVLAKRRAAMALPRRLVSGSPQTGLAPRQQGAHRTDVTYSE